MKTNYNKPDDQQHSRAGHHKPAERGQRREPLLSGFSQEEDFEEPDRDTNYSSGYAEDRFEEDDFHDRQEDDLFGATDEVSGLGAEDPWDDTEPGEDDGPDSWDEEDYPEEDEDTGLRLPLGLIAVALIALILLGVGGYGVIQQRAAAEEEIRQLRASLATAANPRELSAGRSALEEMRAANKELAARADSLALENKRLNDTVAGLEAQLLALQAGAAGEAGKAVEAKKASVQPAPEAASPPATATTQPKNAAAASQTSNSTEAAGSQSAAGGWFVNFGSYASRDMARTWASRLKPAAGRVIIAPSTANGTTLYRVRVIDLSSKETASRVARQLESELGVSRLWVGSD